MAMLKPVSNAFGGGNLVIGGGGGSTNYLYGDALTAVFDPSQFPGFDRGGGNTIVAGDDSVSYMWGAAQTLTDPNRLVAGNTFVFANGDYWPDVENFRHGVDIIDIKSYSQYTKFAQLNISSSGGVSTIHLGSDQLLVQTASALVASDFKFG